METQMNEWTVHSWIPTVFVFIYFVDLQSWFLCLYGRQIFLHKNRRVEGLIFLDIKIYYKATIIKTVWIWCWDRWLDQCYRVENPKKDPHTQIWQYFSHIWNIWGKNEFVVNSDKMIWIFTCKNIQLDFNLHIHKSQLQVY